MNSDTQWVLPMLDIIRGSVPPDVDPRSALNDGMHLSPETSDTLRLAFLAKGFIECGDETGLYWIPSAANRKCGLQFAYDLNEGDTYLWVFYDHSS